MPWPLHPSGPPPLREWGGDVLPDDVPIPAGVAAFLDQPGHRARLVEVDGALCATLIAASFGPEDREPLLERVDLILLKQVVLLRRHPISGMCQTLSQDRIADQWSITAPEQRDTSVLFLQILDSVVDTSGQVIDEVRHRVGALEEHLLAPNPPLNRILSSLLELSRQLGSVRDGLLPLRGELRELVELREPVRRGVVSAAGGRWLRNVESDLLMEVPATLAVAEQRIAGAFAQLQGERSEATNRVVLLLTIITVAFFLPTLLTGLYGMNVPLPAQQSRAMFWTFVGVAVLFLGVAGAAITRLGLWGTFWSVLPGRRSDASPAHEPPRASNNPRD